MFHFLLMHDIWLSPVNSTVIIQGTKVALDKNYNAKEIVYACQNQAENDQKTDDNLIQSSSSV